jgi:hypothetical protein
VPLRLDVSTVDAVRPLAPSVVVGVDDIKSRWLVQSFQPEWLVVGATAHFLVIVSEHMKDMPCASVDLTSIAGICCQAAGVDLEFVGYDG